MTFTELTEEIRRIGGFGDATEDDESVEAAARAGLRMIGRAGAWPWLKTAVTIPLVASQYNYRISSFAPLVWRFDTKSFRYAGNTSYLRWSTAKEIDYTLEPSWKDAAASTGTPSYITREGWEIWVAPKPSAAHIALYTSIYGYGWQSENVTGSLSVNNGSLLLPDDYSQAAIHAGLAEAWLEEDDSRAEQMLARFQQVDLVAMMETLDVGQFDRMKSPAWNYHEQAGDSYYGDG